MSLFSESGNVNEVLLWARGDCVRPQVVMTVMTCDHPLFFLNGQHQVLPGKAGKRSPTALRPTVPDQWYADDPFVLLRRCSPLVLLLSAIPTCSFSINGEGRDKRKLPPATRQSAGTEQPTPLLPNFPLITGGASCPVPGASHGVETGAMYRADHQPRIATWPD